MRVAVQKVDGVQSVRVSLNGGLTVLDLKPGNAVTLTKLRQIIKNNGFVTDTASIDARGSVVDAQTFVVSGTNERIMTTAAPDRRGDEWSFVARAPAR